MSSYLTSSAADAIALTLPPTLLSAYNAALDAAKTTALELASYRIDNAYRWQGRKYDPTQALEFPRVAYESSSSPNWPGLSLSSNVMADTVWDWDTDASEAIVPAAILRAVCFEADSILASDRNRLAQAIHDGLASQSVGGMSESYRGDFGPNGLPVLCRDADVLVRKYTLRSGRIL